MKMQISILVFVFAISLVAPLVLALAFADADCAAPVAAADPAPETFKSFFLISPAGPVPGLFTEYHVRPCLSCIACGTQREQLIPSSHFPSVKGRPPWV